MSKIIGVTVGTTINPQKIIEEIPEGGGGNSVYFSEEEPTDAKTGDFWYDESEGESEEANADYIPVPQSANIGQTIVVKEVDENGKPTKWEAVDLPSGGSSDGDFFIVKELNYDPETNVSTFDKTALEIGNAVWNEGKAPVLLSMGSFFSYAGGSDTLARFNGVSYNINGGIVEVTVFDAQVFEDGTGVILFVRSEMNNLDA